MSITRTRISADYIKPQKCRETRTRISDDYIKRDSCPNRINSYSAIRRIILDDDCSEPPVCFATRRVIAPAPFTTCIPTSSVIVKRPTVIVRETQEDSSSNIGGALLCIAILAAAVALTAIPTCFTAEVCNKFQVCHLERVCHSWW